MPNRVVCIVHSCDVSQVKEAVTFKINVNFKCTLATTVTLVGWMNGLEKDYTCRL